MKKYLDQYKNELLENVIPFWEKFSPDRKHGGFYTSLDRAGNVYDRDKFIWLQARQTWMFSLLYDKCGQNKSWITMAENGGSFLARHGRDAQGNWFFSVTEDGKPLVQPYNIFTDCYAVLAFAGLDRILPGRGYSEIALQTLDIVLKRRENGKGIYNKNFPGTRPLKSFSLSMMLCNMYMELENHLDPAIIEKAQSEIIHEVMDIFYQPEIGLIVEHVDLDGKLVDSFEGRLLNPGHVIEAMWFLMDLGEKRKDLGLISKARDILLRTLEKSWDMAFGGIFYLMDRMGHPPQQLEWDQKLWWVHVETLVALAKGYFLTRDSRCTDWFERVHEYS